MKITDVQGLYVAHNKAENYNVLVCAQDREEAKAIAVSYFDDAYMEHDASSIEIQSFDDVTTRFDCDYVISAYDVL